MCKGKDVCPLWTDPATGNRIAATGCSDDQLLPTSFELAHGKHLTCDCSGAKGDRSTAWACGQQPFTHWDATVLHLNGTGKCCSLRMARAARSLSRQTAARAHGGGAPGLGLALCCVEAWNTARLCDRPPC